MDPNRLFQKILYPTDFSDISMKAINYAVQLSVLNQAELFVLYTYRLVDMDSVQLEQNISEIKKKLEQDAFNKFQTLNNTQLQPSGVRYTYLSEVGFIADRIMNNVNANNIDLLILCNGMQKKMEDTSEKGHEGLIRELPCPIMYVPKNAIVN